MDRVQIEDDVIQTVIENNIEDNNIHDKVQIPMNEITQILGNIQYKKWARTYNRFFKIEIIKGRLLCYKKMDSKKHCTAINLVKAQFLQEDINNQNKNIIEFKSSKGKKFKITLFDGIDKENIRNLLQNCFNVLIKSKSKAFFALLGRGVANIIKLPIKVTSGIIISLEKLGDTTKSEANKQKHQLKRQQLNNPASGLIVGTSSMVSQILGAISGLVTEPIKGGKKNGLKGVTSGVGKGLIGLIFKPVAGSIDLVTMTMRGTVKLPQTIYKNVFKVIKKTKKKKQKSNQKENSTSNSGVKNDLGNHNENLEVIYENDDEILLYDKKDPLGLKEILSDKQIFNNQDINYQDEEGNNKDLNQENVQKLIEYYHKQQSVNNEEQQEEMCEFLVLETGAVEDVNQSYNYKIQQEEFEIEYNVEEYTYEKNQQQQKMRAKLSGTKQLPFFEIQNTPFQGNIKNSQNQIQTPEKCKQQDQEKSPLQQLENSQNLQTKEIQIKDIQEDFQKIQLKQEKKEQEIQSKQQIQEKIKQNWREKIYQIMTKVYPQQILYNLEQESESEDEEYTQDYDKTYLPLQQMEQNEIFEKVKIWKHKKSNNEELRGEECYEKGGRYMTSKKDQNRLRNLGKQMIQDIGRKLISGTFNLTTVSFPIKAMIPKSALETSLQGTSYFPLYINRACIEGPLERFKLIIVALICSYYNVNSFHKPLNPILGETFDGYYMDGTQCYVEQISHHPPISYFLIKGPSDSYEYNGYYLSEAKAGFNTLRILNKGKRQIKFQDGQTIECNFGEELYQGCFLGTMRHETTGTITFNDYKNNINCDLVFGKVKKRPSDYFQGDIIQNGQVVSKVYGSYLGFIDIDDKRYWDFENYRPYKLYREKIILNSDSDKRADLQLLRKAYTKGAQKEKEFLEQFQRRDAKLRKEFNKSNVH